MKKVVILLTIICLWVSSCTKEKEEDLVAEALKSVGEGRFESAVRSLRDISSEASNKEVAAKADFEMGKILEYFLKDYRSAMRNAESSLEIYNEIDPELIPDVISNLIPDRVSELESIIEEANKTITAENYLLSAKRYCDSGDYRGAKDYAERAKEIYLELGESYLVFECDMIIDKSETHIQGNSMLLNIFYAAVIIIIIFIIS